ncbi:hypothetical protein Tco_0852332, partial [Tanacetum coccineum]
ASLHVEDDPVDVEELEFLLLKGLGLPGKRGIFGTVEVPATLNTNASIRERTLDDLTPEEKIREACDLRATNIILMGLPPDVYTLPEWSKFVTDVKLAKDMHNASFDQLYAYLWQHEFSAFPQQQQFYSPLPPQQSYEAPVIYHQSYEAHVFHQQPYQAPAVHHQSPVVFLQLDSGLVVPKFLPTDNPIESLNKAMTFLSNAITSRYPHTNNQLRTSSNPRNQSTI